MTDNSLISIVIPCYNVQDKVERCIKSLQVQTYDHFVAYFIDDGSSDHTAEVIKKYSSEDQRINYYFKNNAGQASARNKGIDLANSEFICFIDSDDYVHPDYLKKLVAPLLEESYDFTACYFERLYEDKVSLNTFSEMDMKLCKYPAVWGKMFRLDMIKENNLRFPMGLWYEDLCFFAQLISHCKNTKIVEESLYYYVQNANSTMYTYSDKIYDIYKVFDILKDSSRVEKNILEYIEVYHILVGTIFRASFKPGFNKTEMKNIVDYVERQYPDWYKNQYIKSQLPTFYKIYLFAIRMHWNGFVTLMLKLLNKHVSL